METITQTSGAAAVRGQKGSNNGVWGFALQQLRTARKWSYKEMARQLTAHGCKCSKPWVIGVTHGYLHLPEQKAEQLGSAFKAMQEAVSAISEATHAPPRN